MKERRHRILSLTLVISILMALMSLPACSKSDSDAKKKADEQEYERHKMETKDPDATTETSETTEPSQRDTSARTAPTLSPTPTAVPSPIKQLTEQDIQSMNNNNAIIIKNDDGYISTIVGRFFDRPVTDEDDAINALRGLQTLLGIETGYFPFAVYGSSYNGCKVFTYQQLKGDMVVQNASLKIVLDQEGYPFMLQSSLATNLNYQESNPTIDEADAERIVIAAMGDEYEVFSDYTMKTCLADSYHMSQHCFQVITNNPYSSPSFDMPYIIHFVDYDGNYIKNYPTAYLPTDRFADYGNESYFKDMVPTDYTFTVKRNGEDFTFTVPISYNTVDGKYYLADPSRKIIVADYYEFCYNDGNLVFDCRDTNEGWSENHLTAYYNYMRAYDFYKEFNIESTDGFGMPFLILTGFCESDKTPIANMCNCGVMYGWSAATVSDVFEGGYSMDVCAHEFTHGVTTVTRQGCVYYNEYGSINEGFSEIMGNISEMYMGETTDTTWLIGDTYGNPVQCMSDPSSYSQPEAVGDRYYIPNSVYAMMTGGMDRGGVHMNDSLISNLCYVLYTYGLTLEDLANFFIAAMEMHTTYADFDDMYAVFITAAMVVGRDDIIPVIEQYWVDKRLNGPRAKTNETTPVEGFTKVNIPFTSTWASYTSYVFVYSASTGDFVVSAPIQLDQVATVLLPEGDIYCISVGLYSDYYFTQFDKQYWLDKNGNWTQNATNLAVYEATSGDIIDLPAFTL